MEPTETTDEKVQTCIYEIRTTISLVVLNLLLTTILGVMQFVTLILMQGKR